MLKKIFRSIIFIWFFVLVAAVFAITSELRGVGTPVSVSGLMLILVHLTSLLIAFWLAELIAKKVEKRLKSNAPDPVSSSDYYGQEKQRKNDTSFEIADDSKQLLSKVEIDPALRPNGDSRGVSDKFTSFEPKPLTANEQLKLIVFIVLWIPILIIWHLAVIPSALLIYGYVMMRIQSDFEHVDITSKYSKIYFELLLLLYSIAISAAVSFGIGFGSFELYYTVSPLEYLLLMMLTIVGINLVVVVVLHAYFLAIEYLYYLPLRRHSEWVVAYGAFSRKQKKHDEPVRSDSSGSIIQSENLKQFSVADELAKWAKLRDDGVISEADFETARSKLLSKG